MDLNADAECVTAQVRFLLPALPMLNVAAGSCLARLWANRGKSPLRRSLAYVAAAGVALSAVATLVFSAASHCNYPGAPLPRVSWRTAPALGSPAHRIGGHALAEAHASLAGRSSPMRVHIGTLPAMTGVSRFGQTARHWTYNKVGGWG